MIDAERHLSLDKIEKIIETLDLTDSHIMELFLKIPYEILHGIIGQDELSHLSECKLCKARVIKLDALIHLTDCIFSDFVYFKEQWSNWKLEQLKKYRQLALPGLISELKKLNTNTSEKMNIRNIILKNRLKKTIELYALTNFESEPLHYFTLYNNHYWNLEFKDTLLSGKVQITDNNYYTKTDGYNLIVNCFNTTEVSVLGPEYELTPPIAVLIPKNNEREPLICIPEYSVDIILWEYSFANIIPGAYIILFETSTEYLKAVKFDVAVTICDKGY